MCQGQPQPRSAAELLAMTRRQLLVNCTSGIGMIALASLLRGGSGGVEAVLEAQPPAGTRIARGTRGLHFPPRVKRVVYLHMAGAPSQLDLFDHKPLLDRLDGKPCPADIIAGERFAFTRGTPNVLKSPFAFSQYGQGGAVISELLPHTAAIADELTVVRSMQTDHFNHAPAQLFVQTGSQLVGRPSMGSWVTYGLGSENSDLPGFVVLTSGGNPDGGAALWGSGFLPTKFQGVPLRSAGDPVLYVNNPPGMSDALRRSSIDAINEMNRAHEVRAADPEIATRIAQYELAYRMQASVPELMEIAEEPVAVHEAYGTEPGKTSFANNCLLARRLLERGVRFVQLYHWGWDSHGTNTGDDIVHSLPQRCKETDRASAALVMDLKQRGLLDDTLVIWGGEFGRTPLNEARNGSKFFGRDHHPHAFTVWMAGGGLKKGFTLGKTDDVGYRVVEDAVHVHDLQATILHLLGIDHTKLTFRSQGRDFRLTDVHGEVVKKLLA
ncbi:MAG: DUF1501 domain-containing protein [Phycisphaerales bacterium]|nr:DUF1501 domain-containing protein [Phycisphaerales bacterium]